jgi:hypothetical protein
MPPPPRDADVAVVMAIVERLEPRQLFARDVSPVLGAFETAAAVTAAPRSSSTMSEPAASVAPLQAAAPAGGTFAERFVGTWHGNGWHTERFDFKWFDVDVVVTSVSGDGFVGSISLDSTRFGGNRREVVGTFTGKVRAHGRFGFRLREPNLRVSFKGRLTDETDRLVGSVRMKVGPGMSIPRGDIGGKYTLFRAASEGG